MSSLEENNFDEKMEIKSYKDIPTSLYFSDREKWRTLRRDLEKRTEILLDPSQKRMFVTPIQHPEIYKWYKTHQSTQWTAEELDISTDINDWNSLTPDERHYIKFILAFFLISDYIVIESCEKDNDETHVLEYNFFNSYKIAAEIVHAETYNLLVDTYFTDLDERNSLKSAVTTMPTVAKKVAWFKEYVDSGTFVERIAATCITEGIFFSSSFCSIFWLKKRNLMTGLCNSNSLIARDENLHTMFSVYILRNVVKNPLAEEIIINMVKEAVEIECEFVKSSLPVELIGMNSTTMCNFIKYAADHLLMSIMGKVYYNVENPYEWMAIMSLGLKEDFFYTRPTTYAKSQVLTTDSSKNQLRFDDFE